MIATSGSRVPAGGITFGGHNHKMATSRKRKVDVEVKEKRTYEWIGEGDIRDGARHYDSVKINDTIYSLGDCVYVPSSSHDESVCQIQTLFENLFTNDKEMNVKWFYRTDEIPLYLRNVKDSLPSLARDEIIFSNREGLLSVESIIKKIDVTSDDVGGDQRMGRESIFCRYTVTLFDDFMMECKIDPFELEKPVFTPSSGRRVRSCASASISRHQSLRARTPRKTTQGVFARTPGARENSPRESNLKSSGTKRKTFTSPRKIPVLALTKREGLGDKKRTLFHEKKQDSGKRPVLGSPLVKTSTRPPLKKKRKTNLEPIMEESDDNDDEDDLSFCSKRPKKMELSMIHDMIDDETNDTPSEEDGSEWAESSDESSSNEEEEVSLDDSDSFREASEKGSTLVGRRGQRFSTTPSSRWTHSKLATPTSSKPSRTMTPSSNRRGQTTLTTPSSSRRGRTLTTPSSSRRNAVTTPKATPTSTNRLRRNKCMTTPSKLRRSREGGVVIPVRPGSAVSLRGVKKSFELARSRLHVSSVPDTITCREREFTSICTFVESKICQRTGGCMYISGLPGTGKTATVYEVSRNLQKASKAGDIPDFKFIEINGLKLTDPKQAYVSILKLTGEKATATKAADLLDDYFSLKTSKRRPPILLLADELDMLWNKKQSVLYNLFDWPTRPNSKLIVLAVANTMDLPERVMSNRVTSRLGLTRITFSPYSFNDLQQIVTNRMIGLKVFEPDAISLAARKVAAVTGDARRALDICRRATEIAENRKEGKKLVGMMDVSSAVQELFSSPLIMAVKYASFYQRFFLQALIAEFRVTGLEETTLKAATHRMNSLLVSQDHEPIPAGEILSVTTALGSSGVILLESSKRDIYRRIRLNVTPDDIQFALRNAPLEN